jgi:hypothetical protein
MTALSAVCTWQARCPELADHRSGLDTGKIKEAVVPIAIGGFHVTDFLLKLVRLMSHISPTYYLTSVPQKPNTSIHHRTQK